MLINVVYACRGWRQPLSTEIDLEGEDAVVASLREMLIEALHKERHVYYADSSGAYSEDSGILIVRDSIDVRAHERWHEELDKVRQVSTIKGLGIEEGSSLVIDENSTDNVANIERHKAASRAFLDLYKRIASEPESQALRSHTIDVIMRHAYCDHIKDNPDPRISPWALLADDMKYMLFYLLCRDVDRVGHDYSRAAFIEALAEVKAKDDLNAGVAVLRDCATREVRGLYDFHFEHFDDDTLLIFPPDRQGDNLFFGGALKVKIYSSDAPAADIALAALKRFLSEYGCRKDLLSPHAA
jgi:hypothetical protein